MASFQAKSRCRRCLVATDWSCQARLGDEGTLVPRPCCERLPAHLQSHPMLPQQLTERCGWINFELYFGDEATPHCGTASILRAAYDTCGGIDSI